MAKEPASDTYVLFPTISKQKFKYGQDDSTVHMDASWCLNAHD